MHTQQQLSIIQSPPSQNVKCIAVAGSGKTYTLFGYAEYHNNRNGLYIVYNASNRREALLKAKEKNFKNLVIHTAHSQAWAAVGKKYRKMLVDDIPLQVIINKCHINATSPEAKYTKAQMVKDGIAAICNKTSNTLHPDDFAKGYEKQVINEYYDEVLQHINYLVPEMYNAHFHCTHDFYLKVYANSKPVLVHPKTKRPYDFILFDEGQDANEVMLDIFMRQQGAKIIVGDPAQQIYTWRGAVNALDKVDFTQKNLTNSFRFGEDIAGRANDILNLKRKIGMYGNCVQVRGIGTGNKTDGKTAHLSRTVMGLMKLLVDNYVKNPNSLNYLEGGKRNNKWLYGNSLLTDVYWLFASKLTKIKDPVIKDFKHITELKEFAYNTNNRNISQLIDLIFTYKSEIFGLKKEIIAGLVPDKKQADHYFSTLHKSKGQEYDYVVMDDTFIRMEDIVELNQAIRIHQQMYPHVPVPADLMEAVKQMNEEINIKYVAVTRARVEVKTG